MVYDKRIIYRVIRLYGRGSEIYSAMINGKEISKMIRRSLSDNGVRPIRYREKKMLFEDCKKQEEEFEYKVELYFDL